MKLFNLTHPIIKLFTLIITIVNINLPTFAHHGDELQTNRPTPQIISSATPASNPLNSAANLVLASSQIPHMETAATDTLPVYTEVNDKMEVTVTVPIQLPTGTANNTPQLALHYNDKRSHIYAGNTATPSCYINGQLTGDNKKQCFEKRTQNDNVKWAQSVTQNSLFESAIKHGQCYKKVKSGSWWWDDLKWTTVQLSTRRNDDLKQCFSKHKHLQRHPARWSPPWWSRGSRTTNIDFKWATSADNAPIWEENDVDQGEAEPTLWSITGIPSVQKCQSIPTSHPSSLCLVNGQYETELKKISQDSTTKIHFRPFINQQPQNQTRVLLNGDSLTIHDRVTGKVLLFNKSQRLADTFTLSQRYTLPFKKNVVTYHWVPANPSSHGQLHGYQLSHILYGVNNEHADTASLRNDEWGYNHKIEFQWFKNRATGYPQNIIVHSKVLVDGRYNGTNFSEVFRYKITPDIYHPLANRPTNTPIWDRNSGLQCIIINNRPKLIKHCESKAHSNTVDHGSSALNFHVIGSVKKTAPHSITTSEQRASFIYQGCTANHLGGCLTGIISGPADKQWSDKINFDDSHKQQKSQSQISWKYLWWSWRRTGPITQRIVRTYSTNTGVPSTAADTGVTRKTEWLAHKNDKLSAGHYATIDITDERGNHVTETLLHNNHHGYPTLIQTQHIAPEFGTFPRKSAQHFTYNRQHQLTRSSVTAHQNTSATNQSIQQQAVTTHYRYKDIVIADTGISDTKYTKVSMPSHISVIENMGPQGAGQNHTVNAQRISETEWTYTSSNLNQYDVKTFICHPDTPLIDSAIITPPKHRHCASDTQVSRANIKALSTDWIDSDDSNDNARALKIKDTVHNQATHHQYTTLGLIKESQAIDDSSHHNALSDIITTYEVHDWQVSKVSANNSPYVQLLDEYTLDGTASWQKTFYGDNSIVDSKEVGHTKHQIDPLTLAIKQHKAFANNGDVLSDISSHYVRPSHQGVSANIGFTLTDNINHNMTQQVYNADGQVISVSNKNSDGDINFVRTKQYYGSGAQRGLLKSTSSQVGSAPSTMNTVTHSTDNRSVTTTEGGISVTQKFDAIAYGKQIISTDKDSQTITVKTTPLRIETKNKDNNTVVVSTAYWKHCPHVTNKAFQVITTTLEKPVESQNQTLSKDCYDTRGNLLYQQTASGDVILYAYYPNNRIKHQQTCVKRGTALKCNRKQTYHYHTDNTAGLIGQLKQITETSKPDDGSSTDVTDRKIRYEYQVSEGGQKGLLISQTLYPGDSEENYIKQEYSDFDDTHRPRQVDYSFSLKSLADTPVSQHFKISKAYYEDGDYQHQLKSITYPGLLDNVTMRPQVILEYSDQGTTDAPHHRLNKSNLSINSKDIKAYQYTGKVSSIIEQSYLHSLATGRLTSSASHDIDTHLVNDSPYEPSLRFKETYAVGDTFASGNFTTRHASTHGSQEYEYNEHKIVKQKQWNEASTVADFEYGYNDKQQLSSVIQKEHLPIQHQGWGFNVASTKTQNYYYNDKGDITSIETNQPVSTPADNTTNYHYDNRTGRLSSYTNDRDNTLKQLEQVDYHSSGQVREMAYKRPSNGATQNISMTYYGDSRVKTVTTEGNIEGDVVNIATRYIYGADDQVAITIEDIALNAKCHTTGKSKKQQKVSFEIPGRYKWIRYTDNCHTNADRTFAYHYLPSGTRHANPVLRESQLDQRNHGGHYLADLLTYQYDNYGSLVTQTGPDINTPYPANSNTNTLLLRQYFTPHGKRVISGDSLSLEHPPTSTLPTPAIRFGGTSTGYAGDHTFEITSSGNSITDASTSRPTTQVHNANVQLAHQVRLNYNGIDITGGLSDHRQISGTELLNMGDYRMYSPDIGRFINPDDRDFPEFGADGYNRYMYARNNPAHYIDLDGHAAVRADGIESVHFLSDGSGLLQPRATGAVTLQNPEPTGSEIPSVPDDYSFGDEVSGPIQSALSSVMGRVISVTTGVFHRMFMIGPPAQAPLPPIPAELIGAAATVAPASAAPPTVTYRINTYNVINRFYAQWPYEDYLASFQAHGIFMVGSAVALAVGYTMGLSSIAHSEGIPAAVILFSLSILHSSARSANSAVRKMFEGADGQRYWKALGFYGVIFITINQLTQKISQELYNILAQSDVHTRPFVSSESLIYAITNFLYLVVDVKINDVIGRVVITSPINANIQVGLPDTSSLTLFLRMNHCIAGNIIEIPCIAIITQARVLAINLYTPNSNSNSHFAAARTDFIYGYTRAGLSILTYLGIRYRHRNWIPQPDIEMGVTDVQNSPIHVYSTFYSPRYIAGLLTTSLGLLHFGNYSLDWESIH